MHDYIVCAFGVFPDMQKSKVQFKEPENEIFEQDLEKSFRKRKIKDDYQSDESVQDSDESEEDIFKEKYIKSSEIAGQEFGDRDGFEEFNMKKELEEGDFTKDGVYVRRKDEQAIHDSWLKGITEDDIKKAKEAHEKAQMVAEPVVETVEASWKKVLEILKPGENILTAIARLGVKKVPKWKKVKQKGPELVMMFNCRVQSSWRRTNENWRP